MTKKQASVARLLGKASLGGSGELCAGPIGRKRSALSAVQVNGPESSRRETTKRESYEKFVQ